MKKVGVISIWEIDNYGNRLQNYAMLSAIKKMGYDARTLKLWPQSKVKRIIQFITNFDVSFIRLILCKVKGNSRKYNFLKFERKYITKDRRFLDSNENKGYLNKTYHTFVLGSDQIWNTQFAADPYYFGCFAEEENNVVSYAASIGQSQFSDKEKKYFKRAIKSVKYVSVREQRAAEMIEELGEPKPQVVLDPTMLLVADEWELLEKKPVFIDDNVNYIVLYYLGELSNEKKVAINKYCEENNCEMIVLAKKEYKEFYSAGPSEFIYLIHHAKMVCTDSFHACVFSILFHTPFFVFDREDEHKSMNSRLDTLLGKFELLDRKVNSGNIDLSRPCDFVKCDKILDSERKDSLDYLQRALEER